MVQTQHSHFEKHFDFGSFLPLFLFIVGMYVSYLFLNGEFSVGMLVLIFGFVLYVINNVIINFKGFTTVFNEYLEDMASFYTFGVNLVIFGILFYQEKIVIWAVVLFFAICLLLAMARNWVSRLKFTQGFPIPLNGLFFPLVFYIYRFYFQGWESFFIFYFLLIAVLSVSHYNFLGYSESNERYFVVSKQDVKHKDDDLGLEFLE